MSEYNLNTQKNKNRSQASYILCMLRALYIYNLDTKTTKLLAETEKKNRNTLGPRFGIRHSVLIEERGGSAL